MAATYKEGKLCPLREDSNGNAKPCMGRVCMFWRRAPMYPDEAAGFCGPAGATLAPGDTILDRIMVISKKRVD